MSTARKTDKNDQFVLPDDVVRKARIDTRNGVRISISPEEVLTQIAMADRALNGDSNDSEHDVLCALREWLSDVYEDPEYRVQRVRC